MNSYGAAAKKSDKLGKKVAIDGASMARQARNCKKFAEVWKEEMETSATLNEEYIFVLSFYSTKSLTKMRA